MYGGRAAPPYICRAPTEYEVMELPSDISFFVKVEGQSYSNYRNPRGVYKVNVIEEKTIVHSACAALQVARDLVPFLNENPDSFVLRAFLEDGQEIVIPKPLNTAFDNRGEFMGRAKSYPESIIIQ